MCVTSGRPAETLITLEETTALDENQDGDPNLHLDIEEFKSFR